MNLSLSCYLQEVTFKSKNCLVSCKALKFIAKNVTMRLPSVSSLQHKVWECAKNQTLNI